jgi:hypothetical protein
LTLLKGNAQRFVFAEHGRWAGVDSVWEQKKLEATLCEMLENAAESPPSAARFVGTLLSYEHTTPR